MEGSGLRFLMLFCLVLGSCGSRSMQTGVVAEEAERYVGPWDLQSLAEPPEVEWIN